MKIFTVQSVKGSKLAKMHPRAKVESLEPQILRIYERAEAYVDRADACDCRSCSIPKLCASALDIAIVDTMQTQPVGDIGVAIDITSIHRLFSPIA